jgi:hypothetical protein
VFNITARPIYPGKEPQYLRIGVWVGPKTGLDKFGKNILAPAGLRTPDCPTRSLVTIPTAPPLSPEKLWTDKKIIATYLMSFEGCGRKQLCPFLTLLIPVLGTFLILRKFRKILDKSAK